MTLPGVEFIHENVARAAEVEDQIQGLQTQKAPESVVPATYATYPMYPLLLQGILDFRLPSVSE